MDKDDQGSSDDTQWLFQGRSALPCTPLGRRCSRRSADRTVSLWRSLKGVEFSNSINSGWRGGLEAFSVVFPVSLICLRRRLVLERGVSSVVFPCIIDADVFGVVVIAQHGKTAKRSRNGVKEIF